MSRIHATTDDLLEQLTDQPPEMWFRPMDLGGSDASNHSRVLAKLVRQGLVERRSRSGRGSYEYRLKRS